MYTPGCVKDHYKEIVTKFISNSKPPKVKYTTLINKIEDSGLNVQNLECKLKSIKSNWITKLYNKEYKAPWKLNIEQYFKEDIEEIVKFNLASNDYSEFKDKFYIDMWQAWSELSHKELCSIEEICNQCICNNSRIRIDCKPIVKRERSDKSIIFIKDILTNRGTFLSENNVNTKYNIRLTHPPHCIINEHPLNYIHHHHFDILLGNHTMYAKCRNV
jgi:hypothetical protein